MKVSKLIIFRFYLDLNATTTGTFLLNSFYDYAFKIVFVRVMMRYNIPRRYVHSMIRFSEIKNRKKKINHSFCYPFKYFLVYTELHIKLKSIFFHYSCVIVWNIKKAKQVYWRFVRAPAGAPMVPQVSPPIYPPYHMTRLRSIMRVFVLIYVSVYIYNINLYIYK